MRNSRALLAGGVVVVAVVVAVVLLVVAPGDSDDDGGDAPRRVVHAKLRLEQYAAAGSNELLVSLTDPRLNTLQLTGGERKVTLRCFDAGGAQAFQVPADWPLLEEPGYPWPHIHQPAGDMMLARVRACRLIGPGIDFEGSVPGPLPRSG